MRPLAQWIVVVPEKRVASSYVYVPEDVAQDGEFRIGTVQSTGEVVQEKYMRRRLEVHPGDRIIYSARVDSYHFGADKIDLIEEASILGHINVEH